MTMDGFERFRINSPKVIHETIDGETVIVNLDSGNYYSLDNVGAGVWALIGDGLAVHEIIRDIACRFTGEREEMNQAIRQFVVQLQEEGLIVADESHVNGSEPGAAAQDTTQAVEGHPVFETPALHKYSDMQDLLLLDPIHEVDDTGWPNVKSDNV
jgi:hypothetical protein